MKLEELLGLKAKNKEQPKERTRMLIPKQVFYNSLSPDYEVNFIIADARKIKPGDMFVAIRGHQVDGHRFLPEAVAKGAQVLVVEVVDSIPKDFNGAVIEVSDSREALDILADRFYRSPSRDLFMVGVTGTNGKTSVTYMVEWILNKLGFGCGVLGTINHHYQEKIWDSDLTTPGPMALQGRLREMQALGAKSVAMEVSSHALTQKRVERIQFNTVVFTNLTRDHLDYHRSMKEYFEAKQRLFTDLLWSTSKPLPFAIINRDDSYGARLRVASPAGIWTYGQSEGADFQFKIETMSFALMQIYLKSYWGEVRFSLPMSGAHNAYNAVAAIATVTTLGIPPLLSAEALRDFAGVPGRLQRVPVGRGPCVFVDYAHTPDALENVLKSLSEVKNQQKLKSRIITVFGCGGDRDPGKRPLMGQIAERYSDLVVITSDNPRTEEPLKIINEIEAGLQKLKPAITEVDRRKAIQNALSEATDQDVVLIAGKGHEDYQIIGTEKIQVSDLEVAQEVMNELYP